MRKHVAALLAVLFAAVPATGAGGQVVADPSPKLAAEPAALGAAAVTVAAAGDICDPDPRSCRPVADLIRAHDPTRIATLGDHQYDYGLLSEFQRSYDVSWGSFRNRTMPAIGNHEVRRGDDGYCAYFGAAAACPTHQYRVDLGSWSWIVLDTNGSITTAKKAQFKRLLTASGSDNVAVAFHHAPYSSPCAGCHPEANVDGFLHIAVDRGVDVILYGHDHKYEAFGRMGANGPLGTGIPMFLAGAGGARPDVGCDSRRAGSSFCAGTGARANDVSAPAFEGMLLLTLQPGSFDFAFVRADGTADGAVVHRGSWSTR